MDEDKLPTDEDGIDLSSLPKIEVVAPVHEPIRNIEEVLHESLSIHDRIANAVTQIVGSMPFVYVLVVFIFVWVATNLIILSFHGQAFDQPWSFSILLLISNQVQLLTPLFILVSQNRQQRRETLRAEQEYALTLRTEIETEAMFEYLRQMADRMDMMMRILDMQQRKMISMKETSIAAENRMAEVVSESLVALVQGLENRPCLADVVEMDPEVRSRIVRGLGLEEEEPGDGEMTIERGEETDV